MTPVGNPFFIWEVFFLLFVVTATKLMCIFPRLALAAYAWSSDWLSALFCFVVIGQM